MVAAAPITDDERARISLERAADGGLTIALAGNWQLRASTPSADEVLRELAARAPSRVRYDTRALGHWDGSVFGVVARIDAQCAARGIPVAFDGLPAGVARMLALSARASAHGSAERPRRRGLLERLGLHLLGSVGRVGAVLELVGNIAIAFARLVTGRARMRGRDLVFQLEQCGANAVGIVTLVCFLVGVILAFVGAIELKSFGAQVYVANLVGVAMVREMGPLMVAIVVAGRTGAAFAAELGTMRVTQELDAFTTLDIPVTEFLVLPRLLALTIVMPLLTLFADLVGILGGALIGIVTLKIVPSTFYEHTLHSVTLGDLIGGLVKATVYGMLVACAGCLAGLRAGGSAASVGNAATSAVVDGIVLIILACGGFAVLFYILNI